MIQVIDKAPAATLRQWWVKIPKSILKSEGVDRELEDTQRYIYDEIAFALSKKDPDWIEYLSGFLESNDPNRRCSALFALFTEAEPTDELRSSLLAAFKSKNIYLKGSAIQGFIQIGYYPLSDTDLSNISDQWLAAWAMQYQCVARPKEAEKILIESLKSKNPYLRKFACDIIGDQEIDHLKSLIEPLLEDPNKEVANVAAYNYYEMLA